MNPYPTINIGGEDRPISFGMAAMASFTQLTNTSLSDMFAMAGNMGLHHMLTLTYVGLKDGARKAKQSFPYTAEDVADWFDFDAAGMEKLAEIMDIYAKQITKEEDKKKQGTATPAPTVEKAEK